MKNILIFVTTVIVLLGFKTKQTSQYTYTIVDGIESHYSKNKETDVQFYYWNDKEKTTEIVWGRLNLINKMTQEGWELQSIDSYSKGMYFYHNYIFKKEQ